MGGRCSCRRDDPKKPRIGSGVTPLPPPVRNFTGRDQELERLRAACHDFNLIAVEGPPGTGKTALALELANRLPEARWLRAEPGWRAESVLYALGLAPEGPLPLTERLVLAARNLTRPLVLDDFHRLEDGPLLLDVWARYLRGTTVILTSRERLSQAGLDVFRLRLEGLVPGEARKLLERLLDQHGLSVDRELVLERAQGYPLLLKALVGLVREGRFDPQAGELYPALEHSLSPAERETMSFLAVLGRPVRLPETPELAGLERRFLAERGPGETWWAHEFFRERFLPAEPAPLHARAAELELAAFQAHGDLEAARHALRHLEACGRRAEAAEVLDECRTRLLQSAQYEFLLDWGRRLGGGPRLQIARADALAHLGRTRESLELLEQVERQGDPEERMQALNSRCHLVLEQGELNLALELGERSLELQRRAFGRRPGRVKALNGMALALARMGRIQEAEERAGQALELARAIGDRRGEAYAHYARALAARAQDRWEDSLQAAQACLAACRDGGEKRLTFLSRYLAGSALEALGRDPQPLFQESLEEVKRYPDPLCRSMAELGRPDPQAALIDAEQHGGRVFLAQVLLLEGDYARGLHLARQAGAAPLECELALRLELSREQPDRQVLEQVRDRAGQLQLRGTGLRARLALAACFEQPVGPVDFLPHQADRQMLDFLAEQGPAPAGWREAAHHYEARKSLPYRMVTSDGHYRLATPELTVGELRLDLVHRRLTAFGQPVSILRRKILTSVLRCLMLAYPEPRSQPELYREAWQQPYQQQDSDAAVRKAVSQLRDLLEPERARPQVIIVQEGGYGRKGGYLLGVSFGLLEAL